MYKILGIFEWSRRGLIKNTETSWKLYLAKPPFFSNSLFVINSSTHCLHIYGNYNWHKNSVCDLMGIQKAYLGLKQSQTVKKIKHVAVIELCLSGGIGQSVGQFSQSVSSVQFSRSVGRSVQSVGQFSQSVGRSVGRLVGRSVSRPAGQPASQPVSRKFHFIFCCNFIESILKA